MKHERDEPERSRIRPFLARHAGAEQRDPRSVDGLRPFVLTSGRVASDGPYIGLETQVAAHDLGNPAIALLPGEKRSIVNLCAEPMSVAEVSARLRLHYGVARVLVGDLASAGHLDLRSEVADPHDPELIMRVIRGLRALK